jgi:HK97 family phage portal protein
MAFPKWLNPFSWFSRDEETTVMTGTDEKSTVPDTPRTGGHSYWELLSGGSGTALSIATVYRCVNLLADSVAVLPCQFMRQKDGRFVIDTNSRLHYLLNVQPDTALSAFDFWRQVVQRLLMDGNAYIVPIYNSVSLEIDRLALCGRGTVSHDTTNDTYTVYDQTNAIGGTFTEDEIIHIKGMSVDGKHGVSVLTYARLTSNIATTGDAETLKRFANGGNVRGIISNDNSVRGFGEYQDEELEKTAVDVDGRFQAGQHIVSLPGQVQFTQMSMSSVDMQFLESRKFTVREICRFFGVHPSFVFDDTSNNYKSAEMANVAFLNNTLNPILRKIEAELLRKLVAPTLATKRKFEFNRQSLYACDLESRGKYWKQVIETGLYTVNELRREENKPDVEGGDTVLVSANLKAITNLAAEGEPTQTEPDKNPDDNKKKEDSEDEE